MTSEQSAAVKKAALNVFASGERVGRLNRSDQNIAFFEDRNRHLFFSSIHFIIGVDDARRALRIHCTYYPISE